MKGILYKDYKTLIRQIKPLFIIIFIGFIGLVMYKESYFGGIIASIAFGLASGMISIGCVQSDEQAGWKKYELTLPIDKKYIIGSKYVLQIIATISTVLFSVIIFLIQGIVVGETNLLLLKVSLVLSFVQPVILGSILLPLSMRFGTQKARIMGGILIIPAFLMVSGFEDGKITSNILQQSDHLLSLSIGFSVIIFVFSYILSLSIYRKTIN